MIDPTNGPRAGQALGGRYRFDVPVASGGMAQVWRGTDLVLGRTVAIKLLHPHLAGDPSFVERFRREAQAAARLNDPHIVAIFDSVTEGQASALILQFIDGITLRDRLQQGPLAPAVAVGICGQVAAALEVAHAAGIVHRDVKPGNVLLCAPDTTEEAVSPVPRVRVTDFGIAKALEDEPGLDLTSANTVIGTAKYLAPEQVRGGPIDGRTDLFAVGVMLYESVTGRAPWQGDTDLAVALGRLTSLAPPVHELLPGVHPELVEIIERAIARDPSDRFQTAAELRRALEFLARPGALDTSSPCPSPATSPLAIPSRAPTPPTAGSTFTPPLAGAGPRPAEPVMADVTAQLNEPTAVLHQRRRRVSGRSWRRLTAATLGVAGLLAGLAAWADRGDNPQAESVQNQDGTGSTVAGDAPIEGSPLRRVMVFSYDEYGDRAENDALLPLIIDDVKASQDPDQAWRSQCYQDDLLSKPGFGVILETPGPVPLSGLELVTRNAGWQADIYVSESGSSTLRTQELQSWGPVRARMDAQQPTATVSLNGISGRSVLVFFTSLAGVPLQDCFDLGPTYRMEVIEVTLYGGD